VFSVVIPPSAGLDELSRLDGCTIHCNSIP
jgi:hypothetical protein